MYCAICNRNFCFHTAQGIAAQQNISAMQAGHLSYLNSMINRAISNEIVKSYENKKEKNKKLLLLRK